MQEFEEKVICSTKDFRLSTRLMSAPQNLIHPRLPQYSARTRGDRKLLQIQHIKWMKISCRWDAHELNRLYVDFQRKKHGFRFSRVEQVHPLHQCDLMGLQVVFNFITKLQGSANFNDTTSFLLECKDLKKGSNLNP